MRYPERLRKDRANNEIGKLACPDDFGDRRGSQIRLERHQLDVDRVVADFVLREDFVRHGMLHMSLWKIVRYESIRYNYFNRTVSTSSPLSATPRKLSFSTAGLLDKQLG